MSYFYKIPITSTDSRNPKKKHKRVPTINLFVAKITVGYN